MFKSFKSQVQERFADLTKGQQVIYLADVTKDQLWETYLDSFPEEERQEHNCNSCKQFIKACGNVVVINNDYTVSCIWDIPAKGSFSKVAKNLTALVLGATIRDIFLHDTTHLGVDKNREVEPDGNIITWEHLYYVLPKNFVNTSVDSIQSNLAKYRDSKNVFKRSLDELTIDATETVLELIAQNSLYRGEESKGMLEAFLKIQKEYDKIDIKKRDAYCWKNSGLNAVSKIRNTSIGTLLTDISEGKDLDIAVSAFEKIMAPANYKRPVAIVTQRMIQEAEKVITDLGLVNSLPRRHAVQEDISIADVLFVDRANTKLAGSIFDTLKEETKVIQPKTFDKVEEIDYKKFIEDILPKASSVEVLVENRHSPNFVSLIAPQDKDALSLFKWKNGFSWSYQNAMADSMKENVKAAGGKVDGVLRFSIQWNDALNDNGIDFDAHCIEPNGAHIYYAARNGHNSRGNLDVDIRRPQGKVAVENITWPELKKMYDGTYIFKVHNFSVANSMAGFTAEIEFEGQIHSFAYNKPLRGNETILVAKVKLVKGKFEISPILPSEQASRKIWNVDTNKFHKVSLITKSPNHWGENTGNEHLFFILENAKNEEKPRGFFNEFLNDNLLKHKRVFEALGNKMKVEPSDRQLSGVGFSSTKKNDVTVKVSGNFNRLLKIKF